jgi:DNA-binding GntR family transcriptional regulator
VNTGLDVLRPVNSQATPSLIADQLRELIVSGTLGPGMQVREHPIAEQLGVSRGPVREALARLIQEGLLVAKRNRGVFVVDLGPEDIADIYRARRAIEEQAANDLGRSQDERVFSLLDEIVLRMDHAERTGNWPGVVDADIEFHQTIVDSAGSPRLSRMFGTLLVESRLCISALEPRYSEPGRMASEHAILYATIVSGPARSISKAVRDHLDRAVRDLTGGQLSG